MQLNEIVESKHKVGDIVIMVDGQYEAEVKIVLPGGKYEMKDLSDGSTFYAWDSDIID